MIFYVLYFFSGVSGLIYEIIWLRKLSLVFGTDAYAVSTVLGIFFGGLAIGSFLIDKVLRESSWFKVNPIKTYGLFEVGIGIYAALTPLIFEGIKLADIFLTRNFNLGVGGFNFITFSLSFVSLILPTILAGGTLPLLVNLLGGKAVGVLYGLNTIGGVFGIFLAGFFLVPLIGVNQTIWIAASLSIFTGVVSVLMSKRIDKVATIDLSQHFDKKDEQNQEILNSKETVLLFSYFLAGFSAIGLEVVWTRLLISIIGASTYSFSLVLLAFLIGIALGSLVGSKLASTLKVSSLFVFICFLEAVVGAVVIFSIPFLSNLPFLFLDIFKSFGSSFTNLSFGIFLLLLLVMLIPTFMMGIIFPLIVHLIPKVGKVYSVNTLGGVFGSILAGFLIIPALGVQKGIVFFGISYVLLALILVFVFTSRKLKYLFAVIVVILGVLSLKFMSWNRILFTAGLYVDPEAFLGLDRKTLMGMFLANKILYDEEGVSANVSVRRDKDGTINLRINGKADASTGGDMKNQVLLGQLPLMLHKNAKEVLVVGVGSGITLGSVLSHPVTSVDAVEIEPKVIEAAKFFSEYSGNALSDPRVNLIAGDGRNFLLSTSKRYDVITSQPSNPWLTGSSKLFTQEYFELARGGLKENGIALQWLNLYAIDPRGIKTVLAAFSNTFKEVYIFAIPFSNDLILIGSNQKVAFEDSRLKNQFNDEKIKKDLAKVDIEKPYEILSYFAFEKNKALAIVSGEKPNTDDFPIIEFTAPKNLYSFQKVNPLRTIFENLSPVSSIAGNFDPDEVRTAEGFRKYRLLTHINLIESNIGEGIKNGEEALKIDRNNVPLKEELARLYFEDANASFKSEDYQLAARSYEKSIQLKESEEAYYNLGQSYESDDTDKAETAYKNAIRLNPNFSLAYGKLGGLYSKTGNLNAAIEIFTKLIDVDPSNKEALANLGNLYFLRRDFGMAKTFAVKALSIDPNFTEAQDLLKKLP